MQHRRSALSRLLDVLFRSKGLYSMTSRDDHKTGRYAWS